MESQLTDPRIEQRLRIAMFRRYFDDPEYVKNYIFTTVSEMFEKVVPESENFDYDSTAFCLLVEMKVQALMLMDDKMGVFKKKVEKLLDLRRETGRKRTIIKDIKDGLLRYHAAKLKRKTKSKAYVEFRRNHRWGEFLVGMDNYLQNLNDALGESFLEQVENAEAFATKRPCAKFKRDAMAEDMEKMGLSQREESEEAQSQLEELPNGQLEAIPEDEQGENDEQREDEGDQSSEEEQVWSSRSERVRAVKPEGSKSSKSPVKRVEREFKRKKKELAPTISSSEEEDDEDMDEYKHSGRRQRGPSRESRKRFTKPQRVVEQDQKHSKTTRHRFQPENSSSEEEEPARPRKSRKLEVVNEESSEEDDYVRRVNEEEDGGDSEDSEEIVPETQETYDDEKENDVAVDLNRRRQQLRAKVRDPLLGALKKSRKSQKMERRSKYDFDHPEGKEVHWDEVESDSQFEGMLESPGKRRFAGLKPMRLEQRTRQRKRKRWSQQETTDLKDAVMKYGTVWAKIKRVFEFPGRTQGDLKDKWRNMQKTGQVSI
uniref:Myb-like domain-containing protein n=1 Tax=Lotharella globosa TaxID=91324 RepID=A0A7S4DWA8_9EUKA